MVVDCLDSPREFRSEEQQVHIRQVEAVSDFLGGVSEVQGDGHASALEDAEVDWEPLQAVHEEDSDLRAPGEAARQEEVCEAVRLLVKLLPGHLRTERINGTGLDQRILLPGCMAFFHFLGIDLHQRDVVPVFQGVLLEYFSDWHGYASLLWNSSASNFADKSVSIMPLWIRTVQETANVAAESRRIPPVAAREPRRPMAARRGFSRGRGWAFTLNSAKSGV